MNGVVLRNALKKMSLAYIRISVPDVIARLGLSNDNCFDLSTFLAACRDDLQGFTLDS